MMLMSGFARWNPPGTPPSRDSRRAARCDTLASHVFSSPFHLFILRLLIRSLDFRWKFVQQSFFSFRFVVSNDELFFVLSDRSRVSIEEGKKDR